MTHLRPVLRTAALVWAAPTTAIGLGLGALVLLAGGRVRRRAGALEIHGLALGALFRLFPLRGVEALTVGHVVLGRDGAALERHCAHERVHVRQCERWGPLFLPAYLLAGAWAWLRGRDAYLDNPFEREAFAASEDQPGPPLAPRRAPSRRARTGRDPRRRGPSAGAGGSR